jgi:hypothetical protein
MLKRAIPFILTFTLGLAIASIFVNVVPTFNFKRGDRHDNHREIIMKLERENYDLKRENRRLKAESFDPIDKFALDELEAPMPVVPRSSR